MKSLLKQKFKKLVLFLPISILSSLSYSHSFPSVWDVMRDQFKLNHEVYRPEVQQQIRWIISHPSYLQQLVRSEPYIYHIIKEIQKRNLPGELALLPLIESAFDPFAYSRVGAAGLWQLMPETGNELGLKQDWWYDGRRSIHQSTNAALNYLSYLHHYFQGNWTLAIAAYDWGEGALSNAIKATRWPLSRVQFWQLHVPSETYLYVPRFLALAEIINHPQHYRITLPHIPYLPYFKEVDVGSQIDLNRAARLAGISYRELVKLNPGYNRWATAPYKPFRLLIPAHRANYFIHNLALLPYHQRVSWTKYQTKKQDTLPGIARRYFTTTKLIRELNQLHSDTLHPGQFLLIPKLISVAKYKKQERGDMEHETEGSIHKNSSMVPAKQRFPNVEFGRRFNNEKYKVLHIIQHGETYYSVAEKYHVTPQDIRKWNHLASNAPLHKNQPLIIWKTIKKIA